MIFSFKEFSTLDVDVTKFGEINESHEYSDSICSVMDKLNAYTKRHVNLISSNLNETAKRIYDKDIFFNREEKIAVSCIFNEMLVHYKENIDNEIALCESIINNGTLIEEGVDYDYDTLVSTFSINEGLGDWLKSKFTKGKEAVKNTAKEILDNTKELSSEGTKIIKAKKEDLVSWAKDAKKEFEEKYKKLKQLIDKIVKKGVNSVKEFINSILESFAACGDNLVDAVKSFGGLKMDKNEKPAKLEGIEDTSELYKNVKGEEEKSFFNHIVNRVQTMLKDDKDNASKLMVNESIVDNKFIAFLAGYKNGEKLSWWKCILIGLCASLIVWMLPHVLGFIGLGAALSAFIAGLVGCIWNGIGLLKLIYRRNKERKEGEKFFDKKTAIFFTISVIANCFSVATFLKTIGPLMGEICNAMGWTGGDDMSKFGEFVYTITRKITPTGAFNEGGLKEITEEVNNFGGDVRTSDVVSSKEAAMDLLNKMPGATDAQKEAADKFLTAALNSKGSSGFYETIESFKDNSDLPYTSVFDTSKWGGSGPILKAIKQLKDSGDIPDSVIIGTIGSEATTKASKGVYGFANYVMGANEEQSKLIFDTAAKIAGKDASALQWHSYGHSTIADIITHTEEIKGAFDVLAPNVPFLPMVMPFFDKKKWGNYKMRFASATRGASAYVVDKVEMLPGDKIEADEDAKALSTLKSLHDKAWEDFKNTNPDIVEEGIFNKKDKKEKIEEPQYIVFYVLDPEDTGNDKDKVEDKNKKTESAIGVVIDTLTMMCADVCNFNKSVKIRRRPQPYFMKGLLSRLSFRPIKDNDNETKDYIRTTLGQTMKTLVLQNVLYGAGKKYIDSKVDGKKASYEIRKTILGDDSKKIDKNKKVFELGNFSPEELLSCLTDESKNNKVSYDFLDGKYGSKITIKRDEDGNISTTKATNDAATIENIKYYRVKKEDYKDVMDKYEQNLEDWKKGKLAKRPTKPSFVKGEDGEYYKRASKKWIKENKRKKTYDFVDLRIKPLLKKGDLYKKLSENEKFKKMLYVENENGEIKLHKEVLEILKPFLFRPEKTFAKYDEYKLKELLNDHGVEGEKLGWFKNLFKDAEQLHDTFKELVEIIWNHISDKVRDIYKGKDFKKNHANEEFESLYDELIEEMFVDDYDDDAEYQYDMQILYEESKPIPSFAKFINM